MTDNKNNKDQEVFDLEGMFKNVQKTEPTQVLVLSVTKDGQLDFSTNVPTYPMIHYLLNRAQFEIVLHERAAQRVPEEGDGAKAA